MKNQFELCIAIRIYPKISNSTFIQFENKLSLVEASLRTLKNATNEVKIHIIFILDSCDIEYSECINNIFNGISFEIHEIENGGNATTFLLQIKLLIEQIKSEIVMFCEDDYLFTENSFKYICNFLKQTNNCIVTPFDHPDLYRLKLHNHARKIIFTSEHHWQEINSTCLTFFTTKKTLIKISPILMSFKNRNSDTAIFWILNKHCLKPETIINTIILFVKGESLSMKTLIKSFYFGRLFLIFNHKISLFSPIPTFSTHLDSKDRSPFINWEKLISFKNY